MPKTDVKFYAESDGSSPVIEFLDGIPENARDKLVHRIHRLADAGHELRRPEADYLRDGIYELRIARQRVQYRLLYFFDKKVAVIAHGCTKKGKVDPADIDRAVARQIGYRKDPEAHQYVPPDEPDAGK